jgi:uncharacterized protein
LTPKFVPCGKVNEADRSRYQYHHFQRVGWRAGFNSGTVDKGEFTVIVTSDILREYFEVLNRPKFKLKQETIDKITRYIYQFSEFVVPEEKIKHIEADPADDKFLEAAIAGKVDFIVSGDDHLLELKEFRLIPIL